MKTPVKISTIAEMHQLLGLKNPLNPLVSIFNIADIRMDLELLRDPLTTDFYGIGIKEQCTGKFKYGQQIYDFNDGMVYFTAPHQVMSFENPLVEGVDGQIIIFHPDFLHGSALASEIKDFGFFSYSSNEALFLSEIEERSLKEILKNIAREINNNMDQFTQDLVISNLQLFLKYSDRYYNRQFLTRKKASADILTKLESLLDAYFSDDMLPDGVPTVQMVAAELNLSPNYLSDLLRVHTGQSTQQHIHDRLIEKSKELLSTTGKSVSEIAYALGF